MHGALAMFLALSANMASMSENDTTSTRGPVCSVRETPDFGDVDLVELAPDPSPADFSSARRLAEADAQERLGESMLLSWYDRDRDFESPQHAGECHLDSAVPGYVDYGLYHGARLEVDIENGRFVFFYLPVEL